MAIEHAPLALNLALASAALLGFRHGFDYDHVAAITDITSVQSSGRGAMKMGLMYALGHAATVAALGLLVIAFQFSLPEGIDSFMERIVGITLLMLGAYVLWTTLFRPHEHTHDDAPRTRMVLLINGVLWCVWRVRQALSSTPVTRQRIFGDGLGKAPSFVVGVIHGLGAETPSQLLLFLLAANLGGLAKGLLGLGMFIVGMLMMNTIMCATAAGVFRVSVHRTHAFQWIAGLGAAYSIVVGAIFLAGTSTFAAMLHK
jgi:high-affinity nickel-transport protein